MRRALAAVAALWLAQPAPAQEGLSMGQVQSPILTLDADRLVAETLYGRRLAADLAARAEALAAENRGIEAELTAEVEDLTARRPTMEPEAFRAEADAFDAKVQRIRAEQDAKERALQEAVAANRERFLNDATPVLARLMVEAGAAVILERRDVFLSAGLVDVTDEAVAAIDAALGEGPPAGAPEEAAPDESAPQAPEAP